MIKVLMLGNGNLVLIEDEQLYFTITSHASISFSLTKGVFRHIFDGALVLGEL